MNTCTDCREKGGLKRIMINDMFKHETCLALATNFYAWEDKGENHVILAR